MGYYKRVEEYVLAKRKADAAARHAKRFPLTSCQHYSGPRSVSVGPQSFNPFDEDVHMGALDIVFSGVRKDNGDYQATDMKMVDLFPTLMELMTHTPLVAGKRRTVSTLTALAEDGVWKLGLRDRDHQVSLWVSGETFEAALTALERNLTSVRVDWRKTPDYSSRNRK